jgi:hypothetical protein
LFPLMWIATLFFGCNSYPSRFAESRAMLTMICASPSWVLSRSMSSAHPVLLTLMFPIFSPIPKSCKRSNSGLIYSL